jgi:hypothetical protein
MTTPANQDGRRSRIIGAEMDWRRLRLAWHACDRQGADFLEELGHARAAAAGSLPPTWCGEVCRTLTSPVDVLDLYPKVRSLIGEVLHDASRTYVYRRSVANFQLARLRRVRDQLLMAVANWGSFGRRTATVDAAIAWAAAELQTMTGEIECPGPAAGAGPREDSVPDHAEETPAVVVLVRDNRAALNTCLASLRLHTPGRYRLYIVDWGYRSSGPDTGADHAFWRRVGPDCTASFAAAYGLNWARQHRYIVLLNACARAVQGDWLGDMIKELEATETSAGMSGGPRQLLDSSSQRDAQYLKRHVMSEHWRKALRLPDDISPEEILRRLTVDDRPLFRNQRGWLHLFRGSALQRVGLPDVEDRVLRLTHWNTEFVMRMLACGWRFPPSTTAAARIAYDGSSAERWFLSEPEYGLAVSMLQRSAFPLG